MGAGATSVEHRSMRHCGVVDRDATRLLKSLTLANTTAAERQP